MTKLSIHTIVAALCGSFFLTACPGDDSPSTGTGTEGEESSTGPSVTTMPPPTTTPPGTDSTTSDETTASVDDTSSTGPGESSTGPGESSTGPGESSTGPGESSSSGPGESSTGPGESSTGPGESTTDGGSESTTGEPPPMDGYGDCANNDPAIVCLADEICLYAGMDAACMEQGCANAGDCAVPATGNALPQCVDLTGEGTTECYLSCEAGETCPDGMICAFDLACVWPYIEVPPPMGICPDDDLGNVVPQTVMGDNTGLGDDWVPSCAPGGEDSTYLFTAPAAGSYTFDTAGSPIDTVLSLLDDCAGPELECNDDFVGLTSEVTANLAAGQTVIIVVDGFGGEVGPFTLNISSP